MAMTLVALINIFTGLFFWTLSRRIGKVYPSPVEQNQPAV